MKYDESDECMFKINENENLNLFVKKFGKHKKRRSNKYNKRNYNSKRNE